MDLVQKFHFSMSYFPWIIRVMTLIKQLKFTHPLACVRSNHEASLMGQKVFENDYFLEKSQVPSVASWKVKTILKSNLKGQCTSTLYPLNGDTIIGA